MNPLTSLAGHPCRRGFPFLIPLFFFFSVSVLTAIEVNAHPDVYEALPPDTIVAQYGLGDLTGDPARELAVLFTAGGETRLAIFTAQKGRWALLIESPAPRLGFEAGTPHCLEMVDANLDGRDEILTHSLSLRDNSMITRIVKLEKADGTSPSLRVLLEDVISPPGYPLFGIEKGMPSVTFLKMPQEDGGAGYRRVYCWKGDRFERCIEETWKEQLR